MAKEIELRELQTSYNISADSVELGGEAIILRQDGAPLAAIVPIEEYERFKAWCEREEVKAPPDDDPFEQERATFERLKPGLLKTHRGQYVAIIGDQMVDADRDRSTLVQRTYNRFGYRHIYVQMVSEQIPMARVPSVWKSRL